MTMEKEIQDLFNALKNQKTTIDQNLNRIYDNIVQVSGQTHILSPAEKHEKLSRLMKILSSYYAINFILEETVQQVEAPIKYRGRVGNPCVLRRFVEDNGSEEFDTDPSILRVQNRLASSLKINELRKFSGTEELITAEFEVSDNVENDIKEDSSNEMHINLNKGMSPNVENESEYMAQESSTNGEYDSSDPSEVKEDEVLLIRNSSGLKEVLGRAEKVLVTEQLTHNMQDLDTTDDDNYDSANSVCEASQSGKETESKPNNSSHLTPDKMSLIMKLLLYQQKKEHLEPPPQVLVNPDFSLEVCGNISSIIVPEIIEEEAEEAESDKNSEGVKENFENEMVREVEEAINKVEGISETMFEEEESIIETEGEEEEETKKYELLTDDLKIYSKVKFCRIVNPSEFYITTNTDLLLITVKQVHDMMSKRFPEPKADYESKQIAKDTVGDYCIAYIPEKKHWYRVEVTHWRMDDEEQEDVVVNLIDCGPSYECSYQFLRPMTARFAEIPKVTYRCYFAELQPPMNKTSDSQISWPRETIEGLHELCMGNQAEATFVVIHVFKNGDRYGVDLYDKNAEGDKTVSTWLIEQSLAMQTSTELCTRPKRTNPFELMMEEDAKNLQLENNKNICETIAGYDARDEARICPFTTDAGNCYKGLRCHLEHTQHAPDGITTDRTVSYTKAFNEISLPQKGETIKIVITAMKNCCRFYGHILTTPRDKKSLYNEDFEKLCVAMSSLEKDKMRSLSVLPGVGEIVMVKVDASSQWYRAAIEDISGVPESVSVMLVDLGLKQTVSLADMQPISADFLHVPFQAVEMVLVGYQQKTNVRNDELEDFFATSMQFNMFSADVISDSLPMQVHVWDSKFTKSNFGDVLVQFQLAEVIHQNLNPSTSVSDLFSPT